MSCKSAQESNMVFTRQLTVSVWPSPEARCSAAPLHSKHEPASHHPNQTQKPFAHDAAADRTLGCPWRARPHPIPPAPSPAPHDPSLRHGAAPSSCTATMQPHRTVRKKSKALRPRCSGRPYPWLSLACTSAVRAPTAKSAFTVSVWPFRSATSSAVWLQSREPPATIMYM